MNSTEHNRLRKQLQSEYKKRQETILNIEKSKKRPASIMVLFVLTLLFAAILFGESAKITYPDFVIVGGSMTILGLFMIFAIWSTLPKTPKMTQPYSESEALILIRQYLSQVSSVQSMSDKQITNVLGMLQEYLQPVGTARFLDEKKYTKFLNDRGIVISEQDVELLFDAQAVYIADLQVKSATVTKP